MSRRLRATARWGWPRMESVAREPSGRSRVMGPFLVSRRTAVRPGPSETVRRVVTPRRSASHMASSSPLGLYASPSTSAAVISMPGCWSSAAASIERHGVIRAHARSVSPGV